MALLFDFAAVAAALALTGFFVLPRPGSCMKARMPRCRY
jgi:hypothetical protein